MSELKEHLFVPYSELQEGDELTDAITIAKSYYLKSEADKVITELEESHKMEVEQLLILNREQAISGNKLRDSMEQALRHQKYKRCLAMAKWCENKLGTVVKPGWWDKWHKRWFKLAEKFKETE
jgi:hypothetical protein